MPRVQLRAQIPKDGWYVINLEGRTNQTSTLTLRTGEVLGRDGTNVIVDTLVEQTRGPVSFPVLVELSAGRHYFSWVLNKGHFNFQEINVFFVKN